MNSRLKKLTKCQSFWPLMVLLAILLVNGVVSGGAFFQMRIVDGHLYGRLIDILRNGSKLMLLATGMTMVLATGGTDISVGSVMACLLYTSGQAHQRRVREQNGRAQLYTCPSRAADQKGNSHPEYTLSAMEYELSLIHI